MSIPSQPNSASDVTIAQLRAVLELSPVPTAILQWDKVTYVNHAGSLLLACDDPGKVVWETILGFANGDEREESRRRRLSHLKTHGDRVPLPAKKWVRRDGKWLRQSGDPLLLEVKAWPIPIFGGGGTQVTFTPVKGMEAADADERSTNEHALLAMDSAQVGIWDLDPVTGVLQWSGRCNEIFGDPFDGAGDYATFVKLLHPEDRARTEGAMRDSLDPQGNGQYGCDYRILRPDGKVRWIAAKGHAYFSRRNGRRHATRLVGAVFDITELRQADASLRQSEKLDVTGRLAASIAHEINNPLEAITNLLYLLDDGPLKDDQRKYVKLAQEELARVVDISTQALRFYQDPSAPTQCNLAELTDSVLQLFSRRMAGLQIHVERQYGEDSTVLGTREELRQAIANLVHNAVDSMPHGGRLLVRTKAVTRWPARRKGVQLTIADTGHGMDRTTARRVFEPFFTTRPEIGIGLGLWLTAGMVRKHGGSIRVKSRPMPGRGGTVFSLFLPKDRRK